MKNKINIENIDFSKDEILKLTIDDNTIYKEKDEIFATFKFLI